MSASMTASMISTPSPALVQLPAKSKTPEPEHIIQHESIDSTTTVNTSTVSSSSITTTTTVITNGVPAITNGTSEIEQVATTAIDEIVAAATDAVLQKAASIDRDSIEGDGVVVVEEAEPEVVKQEIVVVVEPVAQQQQPLKPTIKAVADLNGTNLLNDSTDNGDLMTGRLGLLHSFA